MTFIIWRKKLSASLTFISVQFSRSVVPDSLRPHESQHARTPCPSPTPGVHSNLRSLSRSCHPAISSCCPLFLLAPTPKKEECAINLPSQRVSAYQDKIVHLNNFNIINVNNLVGTEIYGKSVSIWQILIG